MHVLDAGVACRRLEEVVDGVVVRFFVTAVVPAVVDQSLGLELEEVLEEDSDGVSVVFEPVVEVFLQKDDDVVPVGGGEVPGLAKGCLAFLGGRWWVLSEDDLAGRPLALRDDGHRGLGDDR